MKGHEKLNQEWFPCLFTLLLEVNGAFKLGIQPQCFTSVYSFYCNVEPGNVSWIFRVLCLLPGHVNDPVSQPTKLRSVFHHLVWVGRLYGQLTALGGLSHSLNRPFHESSRVSGNVTECSDPG